MPISEIYNETELALFYRQAHFIFNEYHRSADGTVCAFDKTSAQLFIGQDLRKNCVHPITSVRAFTVGEDGSLCVTFANSRTICVSLERAASEALAAELKEYMPERKEENVFESTVKAEAMDLNPAEDGQFQEDLEEDRVLTDTLSILANAGRDEAISYLMSSIGLSFDEAFHYVDNLEAQDDSGCEKPSPIEMPELKDVGKMSKSSILATVKELRPGDRIHIEYKPLIGKLRVFDAEYRGLHISIYCQNNFTLYGSGGDFKSLMEDISSDLLDYIHLDVICSRTDSAADFQLNRVKTLTKLIHLA